MKKILMTAVIALVLLGATVPGYMGWETQKQMNALAAYIDGMPGYGARWVDYQRGWFNSHGRMEVAITLAQMSSDALTLPVDFTLQHGPILTGAGRWQLGWFDLLVHLTQDNETYLQEMLTVQDDGPIYEMAALMALNGTTSLADRWLPAVLKLDGATVTTQGYTGNGHIGLDQVLHYNGVLQPIVFAGEESGANLGAVEFELKAELARATDVYVVPGKMVISAESLSLRSDLPETRGQWQLGDFTVDVATDIDDSALVNSTTLFKISTINATDVPALTDVSLGFNYKRIPLAFIGAYQSLAEQAPEDAGPEYWQTAMGGLVIEQLLPASPEFELSPISFTSDKGKGSVSLRLGVDGKAMSGSDVSPINPLAIMPFLNAHVDVAVTQAVLEQIIEIYAEQNLEGQLKEQEVDMSAEEFTQALEAQKITMLEMLRLQGLLVREGDNNTLTLTLSKGQATLNGKPLPLPF